MTDERHKWNTSDIVQYCWSVLQLPEPALNQLKLRGGDEVATASSFKIGHLAQSTIALSALLAALVKSHASSSKIPRVFVDRKHAVAEFASERLYLLNGKRLQHPSSIGGLHPTKNNGYVRVHDGFPNHRNAALKLVGCSLDASREAFGAVLTTRDAIELEREAADAGAVIHALRTYEEWDATPQGKAVQDFPIVISKIANSAPIKFSYGGGDGCLKGLRVLEISRVIATPVAGRCLAVHGADVLWITSPNLPDQPELDIDFSRGKKTVRLDINDDAQRETLLGLLDEADVFLQGYRPGSLQARGLGINDLLARKGRNGRPLICANLSAWGTEGPWANRRGFDSMVQTASGMNVSEAEHYGSGPAKVMPCQALDHGAGFMLASGIMTALYRQMTNGGSYTVDVSLAGVMKHLRSLGQYQDTAVFDRPKFAGQEDVPIDWIEKRQTGFGTLTALKHAGTIEDVDVGWTEMPKPLGSDEPKWQSR